MSFSIQTNVNSLIAQENLRVNTNFQNQTIQRLTSGYRINSSGDDAAGLAIANKFRNDTAELSQGVRNANDGISALQIIDGGMNNISKMLDRLKTLATQSASATFTGDRSVLNSEYQSLITEIDRQAQGIGLATGGHFVAKMGVYVGGGANSAGTADTANGTIQLDLSNSAVDTKALALRTSDFEVATKSTVDIGSGSATGVANIATANSGDAGVATFNLAGPAFSGIQLSVNISGLTTPQSVADAINAAINVAGNSNTAFRDASIAASVNTNSDGTQQLAFSSTKSAFQVQAGTKTANALLGNFQTGSTVPGTGAAVTGTLLGATMTAAGAAGAEAVKLQVTLNGTAHLFSVTISNSDPVATLLTDVTSATDGGGSTLAQLGVTVTNNGGKLQFVSPAATSMQVAVAGDQNNSLGLGTWQADFATKSYAGTVASGTYGAGTAVVEFSVNGGDKIAVSVNTASAATVASSLTSAIANNATLTAAGITAAAGVSLAIASTTTNFRVNVASSTLAGFDMHLGGATNAVGTASVAYSTVLPTQSDQNEASGAAQTGLGANNDVFSFSKLVNQGDQQTLSFSAMDSTGALQATAITLNTTNAGSLDAAISALNTQLQSNSTLKNIVAVKEMNQVGTAEGIRFVSSLSNFSVKVGNATNFTNANPVGMYDGTSGATSKQGVTVNSSASGAMDITTISGAQEAVVALGSAVQKLGGAQAAVGKGQNQLNYAIGLAQSQISNFSAAESRIRDADVAAEAANLTKAQVLQQASMAAMAQANSAPQAVLSLLKG